ncbi:MAG TPA: NurA domain-containing protein [Planctomycetales bacterium]|jgi:DNA-directed RNA polymerase subunit RPC12/RpoP|nr:NurA domain-containing protein [Planctomycetales bacterium]
MGYSSRTGRRPAEFASKAAHSHLIQDAEVQGFLTQCDLPKRAGDVKLSDHLSMLFDPVRDNPIEHVIAIDGGYTEVAVQKEFPSATVCFFQFGALIFSVADLEELEDQPFIDPDDIAKLKKIQRLKLVLPVCNVALKNETTLTRSVRRAVFDFFCRNMDDDRLIETLRWFIFQEYGGGVPSWTLASCPLCRKQSVRLDRASLNKDHTFRCPECSGQILLTDVFRLHEVVDDELGAREILGYLTTTIEQMILLHLIRVILRTKPGLLNHLLFIKDGPLAFFGQTANMHQPMRSLVRFLFDRHNLYLAGLEKSGAFVEHAAEISQTLASGSILLLDDVYIYRYVLPGNVNPAHPYGSSTYYSCKLIFKTPTDRVHVVTVPTIESNPRPSEQKIQNLASILTNVEKLRCDMYDNALLPIALVNKLVSLANHPSARILEKFAANSIGS